MLAPNRVYARFRNLAPSAKTQRFYGASSSPADAGFPDGLVKFQHFQFVENSRCLSEVPELLLPTLLQLLLFAVQTPSKVRLRSSLPKLFFHANFDSTSLRRRQMKPRVRLLSGTGAPKPPDRRLLCSVEAGREKPKPARPVALRLGDKIHSGQQLGNASPFASTWLRVNKSRLGRLAPTSTAGREPMSRRQRDNDRFARDKVVFQLSDGLRAPKETR